MLVALFNDKDPERVKVLRTNVVAPAGIDSLKHKPRFRTGEVDEELLGRLRKSSAIPAFSFIDPFGYRGLTLELVDVLMQGWGRDMVLFFFLSIGSTLRSRTKR
jgi:three-Cys-motif partner protein